MYIQIVVDPKMEFFDIVPEYPDSHHDSRIFQNSRVYMRYKNIQRRLNGILLGYPSFDYPSPDSGYPSLPFLLTLVTNPQTDKEQTYDITFLISIIFIYLYFFNVKCICVYLDNNLLSIKFI